MSQLCAMNPDLHIGSLWVGHWPGPPKSFGTPLPSHAFVIETCLRRLVVTNRPDTARQTMALRPVQMFSRAAAYQFLLEVATGLQSAIPGETNVFGQIKRAWDGYRRTGSCEAIAGLSPVIERLFSDTREIRQTHLQNIGGASYGSLVRRMLKPAQGDRVLLVGAGELAASMLPYLRAFDLGVWNRRPVSPLFSAEARVFEPDEGARAAEWAHHVIMTTPADPLNDARWASWLGGSLAQNIVHLGRRRGDELVWPSQLTAYDLDDLFDLRGSQDNIRSLQLQRARLACIDRAGRLAPHEPRSPARLALG